MWLPDCQKLLNLLNKVFYSNRIKPKNLLVYYQISMIRKGLQFLPRSLFDMSDTIKGRTTDLNVCLHVCCLSDLTAVGQLVRRHVPEAIFLESIGQEITYVLPYSGARDGTFALLFQELDLEMADLGLTSYGISDTTLEEVREAWDRRQT